MFDIGWSELLVIGIVALIAIGPKELPGVLRTVGQYMGKIRRMASEFQGQFQEAMREAEVADLKKQVDEMTETATSYTHFDPIESIRKEFSGAIEDKPPETQPDAAQPEGGAAVTEPVETAVVPVASAELPAPVSQDFSIPHPEHGLAQAAEAPQPKAGDKAGEGA